MAQKRRQVCVVVAGMHRSGTSALTRVLNLLGCALPSNLLAANPTNEAGHWEPQKIMELNDQLLASAGCAWDDWTSVPSDWFESLEASARREEAAALFKGEYEGSRLTVLKDPRVCRLLPFWLDVLKDLDIDPVLAIPVRNPLEVVRSLSERDLSEPHYNRLLWIRHVLDAERYSRGLPRYFCSYDDLLENWSAVTSRMADTLGLKWPRMSAQTILDVEAFLKPQLRHHRLNPALLASDRTESEWLRTVYAVISRWAANGEDADGRSDLDRISLAMEDAGPSFGLLALRGKAALVRVRELEEELGQARQVIEDLTAKWQASQADVCELQRKFETASEQVQAAEAASAEARGAEDTAKLELVALRAAIGDAEAQVAAARSEVEALSLCLRDAEAQGAASRSEVEALSLSLRDAEAQGAASRSEVDALSLSLRNAEAQVAASRSEVEALSSALRDAESLRNQMEAAQFDVAALSSALSQAEERATSVESDAVAARQKIRELEQEFELQTAALQRSTLELEATRTSLDLALEQAELADVELGKLSDNRTELEANLARTEAELASRISKIEAMQLALDVSEERISELKLERVQGEQLVLALKANIDLLMDDLKDRDVLRQQLVSAERDLAIIKERLAGKEADLDRAASALRQRSAEADDAYKELDRVRGLLQAEGETRERLERAAEALKTNIGLLFSDVAERDAEIDLVRSQMEDLKVKVQTGQEHLHSLLADTQITVERLVVGIARQPVPLFQSRRDAVRQKAELLRTAGVVDAEWYASRYPDVASSGIDPAEHFVTQGYLEGRKPKR